VKAGVALDHNLAAVARSAARGPRNSNTVGCAARDERPLAADAPASKPPFVCREMRSVVRVCMMRTVHACKRVGMKQRCERKCACGVDDGREGGRVGVGM
jgi:hypothetical protein